MANNTATITDPHYIIKDPVGLISDVRLEHFGGGKPKSLRIGRSIVRTNRAGRPIENGPYYQRRYTWPIAALVTLDDMLRLQALATLLDENSRTHVVIEDRMHLVPIGTSSPKQIIAGTAKVVDTVTFGLCQYAVNFVLLDDVAESFGSDEYLIRGEFFEIPGIAV